MNPVLWRWYRQYILFCFQIRRIHKNVMNRHWHIYRSALVEKFVIYRYSTESSISTVLSNVRPSWNIKQPLDSELCISSHWALPWSSFVSLWLYIYIRPWNQLSLFYQDLVCSDSDLSFLQQSLPCGLWVVMVVSLRFMVGLLTENVCSFWFSFFSTPGSYFPNSSFCHFKHYLPFAEIHQFIWWGCVRGWIFYSWLWFSLLSIQCWIFFLYFYMLLGT